MLDKTGVPTIEQIRSRFHDQATLVRPKAILECYENIPCNPCETSCPFNAIHIGEDINQQPVLDPDKCTGCGICVYSCPGLAIIVCQLINQKARFKIPYELLPIPKANEEWIAVDRSGNAIGTATIIKVDCLGKQQKTTIVTVEVPIEKLYEFVTIRSPYE